MCFFIGENYKKRRGSTVWMVPFWRQEMVLSFCMDHCLKAIGYLQSGLEVMLSLHCLHRMDLAGIRSHHLWKWDPLSHVALFDYNSEPQIQKDRGNSHFIRYTDKCTNQEYLWTWAVEKDVAGREKTWKHISLELSNIVPGAHPRIRICTCYKETKYVSPL